MQRAERGRHILLCTLGASWGVIPEVLGFVAPDVLPLYARSPRRAEMEAQLRDNGLMPPDELWVLTTGGAKTAQSLEQLQAWWTLLGADMALRVWIADGTDQLATAHECKLLRELILRATLAAHDWAQGGQVLLSLAGGRKTMSADMQMAGTVLGAHAWLHVVGPEPLPQALAQRPEPALFAQPLPEDLAVAVMPVVVGRGQRDETLDVPIDGVRVDTEHFPLPLAQGVLRWSPPANASWLADELEHRQRQGAQLVRNYLSTVTSGDKLANWPGLLRLPPGVIDALRATRVGPQHERLLRALPKVDLHRHLGGCLDIAAQRRVGRAIWESLDADARAQALHEVTPLLKRGGDWPWNWPDLLRGDRRAALSAAILVHAEDALLEAALYGATRPRWALKRRHPAGFAAYERPGELSGSAVLGCAAALRPYAQEVVAAAAAEGLAAVELRGSPHKYAPHDPVAFVRDLHAALTAAGADVGCGSPPRVVGNATAAPALRVGFVWILDRRQPGRAKGVIEAAVQAQREFPGFMLGVDLAGDERTSEPEKWAQWFEPAFRECLFVTVHAGEDEPADNIWQAAYHLHADRIGHGLTLADNRRLMSRFRERGICLELCPTSNMEVVGFDDPQLNDSSLPAHMARQVVGSNVYPLREFLDAGLPLTLCTDNPGISRTTLANEYVVASRLTPGGLTLWEALTLMYQSFARSFLPAVDRQELMHAADAKIVAEVLRVAEVEPGLFAS
ncbi:Aminodeoxyfutalosine deaminase [Tepidimonas taiwanensis]|uniref:adenosine deaminase n=2 Tax=Tepidimonas taiwanensis TaxID=307486 RepID=A0A554X258_9BURK|nr:Aminodeoxyfutalosine deaminase [Tepidimonas taiwanensis]